MADISKVKLPNNTVYDIKDANAIHVGDTINATTVNNHTVQTDVPANAVFTDTTYTPASATPLMDGTAAVGTSVKYAREDHRHPTDTRIATKIVASRTQPTNQQTGDIWLVLADGAASYTDAEGRSF